MCRWPRTEGTAYLNTSHGAKDPETGRVGIGVIVPLFGVRRSERLDDGLSVFTAEMVAIILALQWIEEVTPDRAVICTDSASALGSLTAPKSCREDLIMEDITDST
ncbi:hypothetical protein SKAU_G00251380 [Synaphobranchus kaupii]|uniref:RNase H type-1 domain-containing protein n=1 Tax=Synaphobranchus kaupii TaxID=118154 RepID=A0A9Q1F2X5_SYNKA|nr:hypothetical protein SKAU_G00251380 [Synaphobranchus kaupii]